MITCETCGMQYDENKDHCPYCKRLKQWEEWYSHKAISQLPRRVQNDIAAGRYNKELAIRLRQTLTQANFEPDETTDNRKSIYLYGGHGNGKTNVAAVVFVMIMKEMHLRNKPVFPSMFINATDLMLQLRKEIIHDNIAEIDAINRFADCNWLVLDDLGTEKVSEWTEQLLYHIINHRYENLLPTLITSNYYLSALATKADRSTVVSRINGMAYIYHLKGSDFRTDQHDG